MKEADKLLLKFGQLRNIDDANRQISEVPEIKKPKPSFSLDEVQAMQRVRETKKAIKQISKEQKAIETATPSVQVPASPRKNRAYAAKLKLPPQEKKVAATNVQASNSKEHPVTTLFQYYMNLDDKDIKNPDVGESRILTTLIYLCLIRNPTPV